MSLAITTTSGANLDITTEKTLGANYVIVADCQALVSFRFFALGIGASVTMTVNHRDAEDNLIGAYVAVASETEQVLKKDFSPLLARAGEQLEFIAISTGASTSVDWEIDAAYDNTAATIATQLSGREITITSPVGTDLEVEIYQGDDYLTADSRQIVFTISGYTGPSLSGGTVSLELYRNKGVDRAATVATSTLTGTITQASTTVTATFSLTHTQTAAIAATVWWYRLKALTSGSSVITLVDDSPFRVK